MIAVARIFVLTFCRLCLVAVFSAPAYSAAETPPGMSCAFSLAIGDIQNNTNGKWQLSQKPIKDGEADAVLKVQTGPDGGGRVVQSVALMHKNCGFIGTSSFGGDPEETGIWYFSDEGQSQLIAKTKLFGHGQDISSYLDNSGAEWFWLPAADGQRIARFQVNQKNAKWAVTNIEYFSVFDAPFSNLSMSISADSRHIITLGVPENEAEKQWIVSVFLLSDILNAPHANNAPKPISTFPLTDLQQQRDQWRQGLAMAGGTIFVLSGDGSADGEKNIIAYNLPGAVTAKYRVGQGLALALNDSAEPHYEPEGLEILSNGSAFQLIVGIASGERGNRIYRLWAIPLEPVLP